MNTGETLFGNFEKRSRGDALETALAFDLEVVREHAKWRNPELKSQEEAHHSSVAEG